MAKIIISLTNLSALQKIARAFLVVTGLRNNPYVPGGDALADDLEAAGEDLQNAVTNTQSAKDAWMAAALIQSNMEKILDAKYASVGTDVQRITEGNEAKIDTTKFEVRKTPGASQPMPQIEHLTASRGDQPGTVDLHFDMVPSVQSYAGQFYIGDEVPTETQWQNSEAQGRRSTIEVSGLPSNKRVWFREAAVGALGRGPWSAPAFVTVP